MITVEKSDPFSSESLRLIELLSAELAAITGDNGKSHFTAEAMSGDKALWALAKNSQGKAIGCGAIRPLTQKIAELKRMFQTEVCQGLAVPYSPFWKNLQKRWDISSSGWKPDASIIGPSISTRKMVIPVLRITAHISVGQTLSVSQRHYAD